DLGVGIVLVIFGAGAMIAYTPATFRWHHELGTFQRASAVPGAVDNSVRHMLHRKPTEAKAFYAVYGGLVALAAALVLTPEAPLGLLTNAVQTLAGVLLPSATVFLLLLCNDRAVLGPWVND